MKQLGDITKVSHATHVDVITGGSPCQDLSIAGKRAGLGGERSGLFHEMIRVIKEMQDDTRDAIHGHKPRFIIWENVAGAFSSNGGEDFRVVLESFLGLTGEQVRLPRPKKWAKCGAIFARGGSLAWRTFDAQFWGVPQRRQRIALVVDIGGDRAGKVLFKPESERRHIATCEGAWQGTAEAAGGGVKSVGCDVYNGDITGETAQSVTTATGSSNGSGQKVIGFLIKQSAAARSNREAVELSPTLPTDANNVGVACPRNGMTIGKELTDGDRQPYGIGDDGDPSLSLRAQEMEHAVAFAIRTAQTGANGIGVSATAAPTLVVGYDNHPQDSRITEAKSGKFAALPAQMGTGGNNTPLVIGKANKGYRMTAFGEYADDDKASALKKRDYKDATDLVVNMAVRRLTPTECERLQGMPDGWTAVPGASDSSRYKQMGNGWASPQWYYILGNIADLLPEDATIGSLFDGVGTAPMIWSDLHGGDKSLCTWGSEIDKHAQMVTAYHFPETEAV